MGLAFAQDQSDQTMNTASDFHLQAFNSLIEHAAIIDRTGKIIAINETWKRFARENGDPDLSVTGLGVNYLDVCRRAARQVRGGHEALYGVSAVMEGMIERFTLEYPCHPPGGLRWFAMTVSPLRGEQGGALLTHMDITTRKLAERAWENLVSQLSSALSSVERLDDTLPVCIQCKKVMGDQDFWSRLPLIGVQRAGGASPEAGQLCPECHGRTQWGKGVSVLSDLDCRLIPDVCVH